MDPSEIPGTHYDKLLHLQMGNVIGFRAELIQAYWMYVLTDAIKYVFSKDKPKPPKIDELFPGWKMLYKEDEIRPLDEYTTQEIVQLEMRYGTDAILEAEELMEKRNAGNTG